MTPPLSWRSWTPQSNGSRAAAAIRRRGLSSGPMPSPAGLRGDRANFDEYHVDPSEYIDQGSRVVVKGHFSGKNRGGAVLNTGFEHVFDMRDGKVVRFENKPDDAAAWIAGWTG